MKALRYVKVVLFVFLTILVFVLPLSGAVYATVRQIQEQYALYGAYNTNIHIWGYYDFGFLTLLLYVPLIIWARA